MSRGTEAGRGASCEETREKPSCEAPGGEREIVSMERWMGNSLYCTIWKIGKIPRDGRLHPCSFLPLVQCFQGNIRHIEPTSLQLAQTNYILFPLNQHMLTVSIVFLFQIRNMISINKALFLLFCSSHSINTNTPTHYKHKYTYRLYVYLCKKYAKNV